MFESSIRRCIRSGSSLRSSLASHLICLSFEFYCSMQNENFTWVIDAVQKENVTKVASRIVPNGSYHLITRIKCNEMVSK